MFYNNYDSLNMCLSMPKIVSIGEVFPQHQVKALHYRSKLRTCIACYIKYLEPLDIDELSVIDKGKTLHQYYGKLWKSRLMYNPL